MRLEVNNLYISYDRNPKKLVKAIKKGDLVTARNKCVICGGNYTFQSGKLYHIRGGNGSGKSTLLKVLSGLKKQLFGQIIADGCEVFDKNIHQLYEKTAMLFAEAELGFFAPSVEEELTLPYKLTGKFLDIAEREKGLVIEKMNLIDLLQKSPLVLSKGEKQRLAFAITLMKLYVLDNVRFVFLDEPTSALDAEGVILFYKFIEELIARGVGVIIVNHDKIEAKNLEEIGAEILYIEDGRILADERDGAGNSKGDENVSFDSFQNSKINDEIENDKFANSTEVNITIEQKNNDKYEIDNRKDIKDNKERIKDNKEKKLKYTTLDPRTKILALIAISTFAVLAKSLVGLGIVLVLALLVCLFVRADLVYAVKSIKGLLSMIFFIAIMQSLTVKGGVAYISIGKFPLITSLGLTMACSFALRMLILVCSALIVSKNDKTELVVALERFGVGNSIAVMVVVAIGFIPVVREEYITRLGALKMRGINLKKLNIVKKIVTYSYLFAPTLAGSVIYSERLAQTMTSRAFRAYKHPTYYRRMRMCAVDYFAISLLLLWIATGIFAMVIF